jgi:hypothetical protein
VSTVRVFARRLNVITLHSSLHKFRNSLTHNVVLHYSNSSSTWCPATAKAKARRSMSAEFSAAAAATTMASKAPAHAFHISQNIEPSSSSLTFSVKPEQNHPDHLQEIRNDSAHRKYTSGQSDFMNSGSVVFSEAFATIESSMVLSSTQRQSYKQKSPRPLLNASQLIERMSMQRKRSIYKKLESDRPSLMAARGTSAQVF